MLAKKILYRLNGFGDKQIDLLGHPYALSRTALRDALKTSNIDKLKGSLLDVGCGTMPYKDLFKGIDIYEGLEIDQPRNRSNARATYFYDGLSFPVSDCSYSCVLCSQVLEHSFEPEMLLSEIFRILQPAGVLVLTIPFFWPEHEQPYDSQRFTSFGLIKRLRDAGFEIVSLHKTNPGISAILQLFIDWLESIARQKLRGRRLHAWRLLMSIPYSLINIFGAFYRCNAQKQTNNLNQEMYLDLVVISQKPSSPLKK